MGPAHTLVGFSGDKRFVQTNHTGLFQAAHHHQGLQSVFAASWPPVWRPVATSSDGIGLMTVEKGDPRRVAGHAATVFVDSNAPAAVACSWMREASSEDTRANSSVAAGGASSRPDAGSPDRADESVQLPRPMTGASISNHIPGNHSSLVSSGIIGANGKEGSENKLSPEALARIETNKEAARKRKATRMQAIKSLLPLPAMVAEPSAKVQAPDTAPRGGGKPDVCNRRHNEIRGREVDGHNGPTWPNDKSISLSDVSHRKAGLFAIDTVNPNAWSAGRTT